MPGGPVDEQQRPRAAAADRLLDLGVTACRAYDRDDLAARLERRRAQVADPGVAVVVLGEFKQGKSTLVNALLGIDACPVDDDIATVVPTAIRFGEQESATATLHRATASGDGNADVAGDTRRDATGDGNTSPRTEISRDDVEAYITGRADVDGGRIESVELTVPRKLLQSGLALVDTPGVGGLASEHGAATMGVLPTAQAVVFVSDASQELTGPELAAIRRAREMCPALVVALTKTDIHPHWERIAELDRTHLANAGIDVPVFPLSSVLRRHALAASDTKLNAESGFPALLAWLHDDVLTRADSLVAASAAREVLEVVDQLAMQFRSRRQVLDDPDAAERVIADLRAAQERAQHLESGAARWQTALNDGVADLNADVDHDLRGRFRAVTAQGDERIEAADPLDIWDEFDPWLRQFVTEEVAANHTYLVEQTGELARTIAELFAADSGDIGRAAVEHGPLGAIEDLAIEIELDAKKANLLDSTLSVMRSGYGGMLMFGMLAGMVGVTLIAPVSVAIGLAMGKKQQREEQKRQLQQRRQLAKQTYRKYVDEVSFIVGKQSRDTLRRVHRELRDAWTERAQELQRSTRESLAAAQEAATEATAGRDRQLADIDAGLARVDTLAERARPLATGQYPEPRR